MEDPALLSTEIEFENDLRKDPYAVKYWWRYLSYKANASARERNQLHERALGSIPGSYKLWFQYLKERTDQISDRPLDNPMYVTVTKIFERALIFMSKMPRIWVDYLKFLILQKKVTETRRAVDRALQSLPLTQHEKIWKVATEFMKLDFVPAETSHRMWRRYLQLDPNSVEDYITHLKRHRRWSDVVNATIGALNNPKFVSMKGKTRHEMWVELCNSLSGKALRLDDSNLSVEKIIRSGIAKFSNEIGQLWCSLALFSTGCGNFDKARELFEEGVRSVTTVKDFSQIFGAYAEMEETITTEKMRLLEEGNSATSSTTFADRLYKVTETEFTPEDEVDFCLERLDTLMNRRPELLNTVLLRQNCHNVNEWHKRVEIFKQNPQMVVRTYTEAVKTVDIALAKGKPHTLWIAFAKWYEEQGSLKSARDVLDRAVQENFRSVDDLASVWCSYAEMELRAKKYRNALDIMKRATATNFTGQGSWKKIPGQPVQERVWRSVKLWSFYADLNETLCTLRSTKNVYDRMIYLKVVTPQLLLHYANFMKEKDEFEEALKVYEQGVHLFQWPLVRDIWVAYLTTFVKRFKGQKAERLRDMFEQCIKNVPKSDATRFYLMYARFEEKYGLARQCVGVYDRAVSVVPEKEVLGMFRRYINVTRKFFGTIKTREVYERAIKAVSEKQIPALCLEYAEVEADLGEIDRARCLYNHCAQYVDPRSENTFWPSYHTFELTHGNQDTFQTMLQVRRSVESVFGSTIDMTDAIAEARAAREKFEEEKANAAKEKEGNSGAAAGSKKRKMVPNPEEDRMVFVPASATPPPDAENEEKAEQDENFDVEAQAIPDSIYADLGGASEDEPAKKRQRTQ